MTTTKEVPMPELLDMASESLESEAARLRIMSLGRPEAELITLNRAAQKISKLGKGLRKFVVPSR
jgi:hypothetical protein